MPNDPRPKKTAQKSVFPAKWHNVVVIAHKLSSLYIPKRIDNTTWKLKISSKFNYANKIHELLNNQHKHAHLCATRKNALQKYARRKNVHIMA
jgi:hypothetical protein